MNRKYYLLIAIFLLSACSPTSPPTSTATPIPPTMTALPTFTNVAIVSQSPSKTATVLSPSSTLFPTATSQPALTSQEIFDLSQNQGQLSPEEIVEKIKNGETLIQAELTDEFLEFYVDAMTRDWENNPVPEITKEHLDSFSSRNFRKLGLIGFEEDLGLYLGEAIVTNPFVSHIYNYDDFNLSADYENGIQIFEDDSSYKAYGFLIFYMEHPETGEPVRFAGIIGAGYDGQFGTPGLGVADGKGLEASSRTYSRIAEEGNLNIQNGDQVSFGFGAYGELGDHEGYSALAGFFDPIILKMYGESLNSLGEAVQSGNLNIAPIIPIGHLSLSAYSENVFGDE